MAVGSVQGVYRLIPLLVGMAAIFYQSHQPGDSFSLPDIANIDKVLHASVYTVLGLFFLYALSPGWRRQHPRLAAGAVILFCLAYGCTDEYHQSFIPGRFAGADDVLADTVGGLLAALIAWGWLRWYGSREGGPGR